MNNLNLSVLKNKLVHFIGIGGISTSALALMLKANGINVQGSNDCENLETQKLKSKNIKVFIGHNKQNIKDANVVVYSSAITDDNVELIEAENFGLIIIKRAELLALIASNYKYVVSVAGSHGKTTATAMICEMFFKAKVMPTIHIGGLLNSINSNFKIGKKKIFVTESCEYKDNFLFLKPDVSVILNIDADHLDYFGTLDNVKKSFLSFSKNTKEGGINIVCYDDENSKDLLNMDNIFTFGVSSKADIYAKNIKEYKPCYFEFNVYFCGVMLGNIKLNILGKHNVYNALACVCVGLSFGIGFDIIKNSIENFSGVERRCELVSNKNNILVYHDYAHHPKQIESMVTVAKNLTKKSKGNVIVVFEPHTFSRTKFLINDFAKSFDGADFVILAPVYSARENKEQGLDSIELLNEIKKYKINAEYIENYSKIYKRINEMAKPNDVVFILGAGSIEKLKMMWKN